VQRKIVSRQWNGAPAYFRVFFAFGQTWFCWWNCFTDEYRQVTPAEFAEHSLQPLEDNVHRLATLTGMNFFSTEIAVTEAGEFMVIDYINDQCHLLTQSAHPQMGVPDEVVAGIARRLVEGAQEMIGKK